MTQHADRGVFAADLERSLESILSRAREPKALVVRAAQLARLEKAVARVQSRFVGSADPILTIALAGGTGVGKSTLINALAGSAIAESSDVRPTTTRIRVYHHRDVPEGGLPGDLGDEALFVAHERDSLAHKVIVDTPDLDSFVIGHRARTRKLLEAAGLVLYVFSPEKYLEERTWSVLREEHHFSSCVAVLNKADRVPDHELDKLTADLVERFASIGLPDIRVFRVCARAHAGGESAAGINGGDESVAGIDETRELAAYIEQELRDGEIARMLRGQREKALRHLEQCIDEIAPLDLLESLDEVSELVAMRIDDAGRELADHLADRLAAVEAELAPLATLKQHERFFGPLRTWLSVADFFRYGLTGIVQRLLGGAPRGDAGVVRKLICRGQGTVIDDVLRRESRALQQELFQRDVPVTTWRAISARPTGEELAPDLADEIEARFDVRAVAHSTRSSAVVYGASVVGAVIPAGLLGFAMYRMVTALLVGETTGLAILGHFAGVILLFFLFLHGMVGMLLPGTRGIGGGVGARAVVTTVGRTLRGWLGAFRAGLEEDQAALRDPLAQLEQVLEFGFTDEATDVEEERIPGAEETRRAGVAAVSSEEAVAPGGASAAETQVETQIETGKSEPEARPPRVPAAGQSGGSGGIASRLEQAAARKRSPDAE